MEIWIPTLFIVVFVVDLVADLLNLKTARQPLPTSLESVQSPEQQQKAAIYLRDRLGIGIAHGITTLAAFLLLYFFGVFGLLARSVESLTSSVIWQGLWFGAAISLGRAILQLPFSIYSTFWIEEKYGFNRTTPRIFITDRIKGMLIGAVLGGLLLSFVIASYARLEDNAYWIIWLGYTAFQFFIVWIAPVTLLPLFLKLQPLPDGDLKSAIEEYRKQLNFKLDGAWVCDASKRSAKSNAFFTGFGRFRRLVLFDTLIEQHPPREITAIVAHEAGHFKLGHIWKMSLASAISSLLLFYVVQKLIHLPELYQAFGIDAPSLGIGMILAMMILDQVQFFFTPLTAYFSRRNEYAADRFSAQTTGDVGPLINGLKRLVTQNLATLRHHPLYVILNDSHPPLPDRVAALERLKT